jgi:hypothetical protein
MLSKGAIIIDNRNLPGLKDTIRNHMKFIPDWGFIHFKPDIKTIEDYNKLLTSIDFWESIPFDKVLIFQHDSMLLRSGIEEFLEWDYVGAPWKFQEHGGNGGLSLRSKSAMLECLLELPWNPSLQNEDVYFSNMINRLPQLKLAPREVCKKFACETIYEEGTLGYHAIEKYLTKSEVLKIKTQYE